MCIYIYEADKITYYAQWTWPKWVVPYRLWRFSHKFEHPMSTPHYFSLRPILSVTHIYIHNIYIHVLLLIFVVNIITVIIIISITIVSIWLTMRHHLVENNRHLLLNATYYTISAGLKQPVRGQASRWRYENGYSLIQVVYPAGHMQRNKPQCSFAVRKIGFGLYICTTPKWPKNITTHSLFSQAKHPKTWFV